MGPVSLLIVAFTGPSVLCNISYAAHTYTLAGSVNRSNEPWRRVVAAVADSTSQPPEV